MQTYLRLFVLWCCCLAVATVASGQDSTASKTTGSSISIDDLKAPTSPAFTLLDIAPSNVERPVNPKAFTVNLVDAISQANGLPQNYALEVAPYWLARHPGLTFTDYQRPSFVQGILQTAAVSVATAPISSTSGSSQNAGTRLGYGVRLNLYSGVPNPSLAALIAQLTDVDSQILDNPGDTSLRDKAKSLSLQIQDMDAQRVGFIVSAAAGSVWSFPANNFDQRQHDRWGLWITPTYRILACAKNIDGCSSTVDFIGVVRSLHDMGQTSQWDFGGRLLWQPVKQFDASIEILRRTKAQGTGADSGNRTAGIVEYRINDTVAVYGSFGEDVTNSQGYHPLVSLLGLNIGFGAPTVLADAAK